MTGKLGEKWRPYFIKLDDKCLVIREQVIISVTEMLSSNPLLQSLIREYIFSTPISFSGKSIFLNSPFGQKTFAQKENPSFNNSVFSSAPRQEPPVMHNNHLVLALMEKCGISSACADKTSFCDLFVQSGISFPIGTAVESLKTIADKFKKAGLSCEVMEGNIHCNPKIVISKKKSELLDWVKEKTAIFSPNNY
jgi:hypothetical protein